MEGGEGTVIEDYILRYLSAQLEGVPGAIGQPSPLPPTCFPIKKTDGETKNLISTDTLSVYAYATSEYESAQLNERIKQAMQAMDEQDAICNVAFYTDFSDDDTERKVARYQSIYNVTYYSDEV